MYKTLGCCGVSLGKHVYSFRLSKLRIPKYSRSRNHLKLLDLQGEGFMIFRVTQRHRVGSEKIQAFSYIIRI